SSQRKRYSAASCNTCPSGSRASRARPYPSLTSESATAPGETNAACRPRRAAAAPPRSPVKSVVCQWIRSFARSSAGIGRPSRGAQRGIVAIHVRDDDGSVLEISIVAARIGRRRPSVRRQVFRQVQAFAAELHARGAQAHPEHSLELLQRIAGLLDVGDLLEPEDARVELGGSIHVGNRETDAAHLADVR